MAQQVAAALIVAVLLVLAVYYGRQQRQSLRWLRTQSELSDEDQRYYRRQAYLRLTSCALMLVMAALVGGYYAFGVEARVEALANLIQARRQRGEGVELDAEQQQLGQLFAIYCIAVLGTLLAIVLLVAVDVWAIRRYGRRHLRQLQAERRAVIDDQLLRMRSERNGHV